MSPDLQRYYEDQFDLFSRPGWKDLLEDFENIKKSINDISTVPDQQALFFRKGQLDILDLLLQRKTMCEKTYEELLNEKDI